MSKKVHKSEYKIFVKSFPGAKKFCTKDYVKPSLRSTPNHFILQVGTNGLNSNQTSEVIAKEIADLATSLKNNQHGVGVSDIILRTYNSKLNAKRWEVCRVADNNSSINIEGCNTSVLRDINKEGDCNNTVKSLRKDNLNKPIFAHLNINSIRNQSELLSEQIKDNVDALMISQSKIDDSFPAGQFLIEWFCTLYRLDRNAKGGGILL